MGVDSPEVGTGAAEWPWLSRGPQGGQAVRSRRAGRSPRNLCPAAPAVGPVAGGRPGACGGSPASVPASQRMAWVTGGWGTVGLALPGIGPTVSQARAPPHSPLLGVQIATAHGDGEEARGAVWGAVAVQESSHVEAKVHGAGQVVRVCVHPPDDLSSTRPSSYSRGPSAWASGCHPGGLRAGGTGPGCSLTAVPHGGQPMPCCGQPSWHEALADAEPAAWVSGEEPRPQHRCYPTLDLPRTGRSQRRTHPPSHHSCGLDKETDCQQMNTWGCQGCQKAGDQASWEDAPARRSRPRRQMPATSMGTQA